MNTKGFGENLGDWAANNWKLLGGLVGAVALFALIGGMWIERTKRQERAATNALYEAQKTARQLAEQKNFPGAEAALAKVSEEFPGTRAAFEASIQSGDLFMDSGAPAEAVKRYELAVNNAKDSFSKVFARYNLGIARETAGQYQEAVQSYDDALKTKGSDFMKAELMMAQARCLEALNQAARALEIYQDVQKNFASSYYSSAAAAFAGQLSARTAGN